VRLSAFDFVPFKPDPALSQPGKLGPGIPDDFSQCLPYRYGFGVNRDNPVEYDLTETFQFLDLCGQLGVKIVNPQRRLSLYNPHIQRPAAYPPSDAYQPPEDPLVGAARQINVVRQLKARAPGNVVIIGTAYSYLQEYLPHVAQYVVRHAGPIWLVWDEWSFLIRRCWPRRSQKALSRRSPFAVPSAIATTAPRNGMISGCYPLDKYYSAKPEFQKLKEVKKAVGA